MKTQNEWLLDRLGQGPITPIEALEEGGIFRLAARVFDLREQGHDIATIDTTRNGKTFATYHLIKRAGND